jgi:hypothetical protein
VNLASRILLVGLLWFGAPELRALPLDLLALSVTRGPTQDQVTLSWTGGLAPYSVYRSAAPSGLVSPGNVVAVTNTPEWIDNPPAGVIFYYEVTGIGCTSDAECPTGYCVDSVCCNTACCKTCESCNLPGSVGTCQPYLYHEDPEGECPWTPGCNGAGGCVSPPGGQPCSDDVHCGSGHCDDGVCCDSNCNGLCESCNQRSAMGTCQPIPASRDPDRECPGCSRCNGQRACGP